MPRMERVNEQLRREISGILQRDLGDPRVSFVSITATQVSKDLRNAKVMFSLFGERFKPSDAQKALDAAKGMIRKLVGERMKMRFTPELIFIYDESLHYQHEIEERLKELNES